MFTAKGIFLLITIILLLAIAWNTDITMVYITFVIALVMFILSFLHLQISIPSISITRELNETAFEDDMLNVKMSIRNNRGLGAYFFEVLDRFPAAPPGEEEKSLFVLNISGRETKKISYAANCYKRGLWKLGPITVVSQDALGFFKMRNNLNVFSELLIYPNLFRVFSFPPLAKGSVSWMGVETAKISGDSHEFFGIREYQRGDAISRMHWPSTARHNKLIVKQFERNAVQEATIVLDLKKGHDIGTGRETTLEYAVKIAGSVTKYLLNEGAFIQMIGYAKESTMIPFGKGESHMYKILEYLAKVKAEGTFSLSQTLEEASFVAPYGSTLIVIMLDNDIESLSSLVQFRVKGIKLILVVLSASTFGPIEEAESLDKEAAKRFDEALASLEAYAYRVSRGDDLEKKFEIV
ncbi:MAG: DUF58 domain-containing protein [Candidatus Omnitrophica bacterium]|nr:DUF58 domain-containing protein [Candidatus Omnitrophota bacterium]